MTHTASTATEADGRPAVTPKPSPRAVRVGWVLTGLGTLFLLFDLSIKLLLSPDAVQGTAELGYPVDVIRGLGVVQAVCLALYLWPRTTILGAVLWTGYLGGAIATHVRVGNPLFSHVLFPVYVAIILWGGVWLRDTRLRAIFP